MKKRNGNNWFRIIKTIAPINNKRQHSVQRNFIFMQKNPKKTKTTQAKRKTCSWDFPFQLNWVEFDSVFFLLLREILLLAEIFHVSLVDDRYFCPRKYFGKWFILFYICVCFFYILIFSLMDDKRCLHSRWQLLLFCFLSLYRSNVLISMRNETFLILTSSRNLDI